MKPKSEKDHILANNSTQTITCVFDTGRPDSPIVEQVIKFRVGETLCFKMETGTPTGRTRLISSVTRGYQHVFFAESYIMTIEKEDVRSGKRTVFSEVAESIQYKNGLITYPEVSDLFLLANIIETGEFNERALEYKNKFSQIGGLFRLWEDEAIFL